MRVGAICFDHHQPDVRYASFEHEGLSPRLLTGKAASAERSYRRMYSRTFPSSPMEYLFVFHLHFCISTVRREDATVIQRLRALFKLYFSAVNRTSRCFVSSFNASRLFGSRSSTPLDIYRKSHPPTSFAVGETENSIPLPSS